MNWTPVWHQAITRPFAMGMLIGEKRTVVFRINAYADGTENADPFPQHLRAGAL